MTAGDGLDILVEFFVVDVVVIEVLVEPVPLVDLLVGFLQRGEKHFFYKAPKGDHKFFLIIHQIQ